VRGRVETNVHSQCLVSGGIGVVTEEAGGLSCLLLAATVVSRRVGLLSRVSSVGHATVINGVSIPGAPHAVTACGASAKVAGAAVERAVTTVAAVCPHGAAVTSQAGGAVAPSHAASVVVTSRCCAAETAVPSTAVAPAESPTRGSAETACVGTEVVTPRAEACVVR